MKHGFTLIEIMLALLVVTIGIVAMVGLLGSSLDSASKTHDDLAVAGFSDLVFNYYHAATNWTDIPPDGTWSVPAYDGATSVDLASGRYEADNQVFSFTFNAQIPAPDIKTLTLSVWPGFGTNGTPRTFYTEIYNWAKTQ